MFRFEHPYFLFFLLLLPLLLVGYVMLRRQQQTDRQRLADAALFDLIAPEFSDRKQRLKFTLLIGALVVLIVGCANPQWGTRTRTVEQQGLDVVIALDISESMLAEDVPPSRLQRAKRFAQNLIENLSGNRIGLVVFAGDAFLEDALTLDYRHLLASVRSLQPGNIPRQGTALADALDRSITAFPTEEGAEPNQRVVVLITDGEDHEGDLDAAIAQAAAEDVLVFGIAVGSEEGAKIPMIYNGRADFKRDERGEVVLSKPDTETLRRIADATDGTFFDLRTGDAIFAAINSRLEQLDKRNFEERVFDEFNSYYQWFIGAGLVLLLINFLISERRNERLERVRVV